VVVTLPLKFAHNRRSVMMKTTTRGLESTAPVPARINLLLAFELGERTWKLGFTTGLSQRPRVRQVPAGAVDRVLEEVTRAKRRLKLVDETPVISCYEAGRDGFWLHRWLLAHGITNHVVDSSSIEVNRRARRAKTDKLDLAGLLNLLARYLAGDRRAWRVVRVPSVAEEDARQLHRTWESVQQDRSRLICRLQGLLVTQGVRLPIDEDFLQCLAAARLWDGTPVPDGLQQRVRRVWAQLELANRQLAELAAARGALVADRATDTGRYADALPTLQGIGPIGGWVLATEIFGWRRIQNRRQLGALVGLVPAPYQSGDTNHDQGITRAGNKHVRRLMVQLAWSWVRYQPGSALTTWYQRRFGGGSKRMRRIGIVALARKLLIALWRYVDQGEIPEGARLKSQAA
jgi:transposase